MHEYGGAAFNIDNYRQGIVFSNKSDRGVYLFLPNTKEVRQIVQRDEWRFADFDVHRSGSVVAIRELHHPEDDLPSTVVNELVLIDVETKSVRTLVPGSADMMFSTPKFSPDGKWMSWLQWSHPEMPWTGSLLKCAKFDSQNGSLSNFEHLAGSGSHEGISQPHWGPDSTLFYATDRSGFFQLQQVQLDKDAKSRPVVRGLETVEHTAVEFMLGSFTYLPMSSKQLVLGYYREGSSEFALVDLDTGEWTRMELPITDLSYDAMCRVTETEFLVHGSNPSSPPAVYKVTIHGTNITCQRIRKALELDVPEAFISTARVVSSPRLFGDNKDGQVYGLLYEPANPNFTAPPDSRAPLIVYGHGGPTGHWKPTFDLDIQYWTSRGIAMVLLNYAGSTGFGKAYRDLLDGKWGVIDSADAASLAVHLGREGVVDVSKLGIYGPSAGGYLALKTICDFPDVWAASVSLFGIADMAIFNDTTHKFESHYMEALLYENPEKMSKAERNAVDQDRSPLTHAKRIEAPLLLLHGLADKVVPPDQSEAMARVLEERGKPVRLELFEGEGHARWQGEALRRSLAAQEDWWREYLIRA